MSENERSFGQREVDKALHQGQTLHDVIDAYQELFATPKNLGDILKVAVEMVTSRWKPTKLGKTSLALAEAFDLYPTEAKFFAAYFATEAYGQFSITHNRQDVYVKRRTSLDQQKDIFIQFVALRAPERSTPISNQLSIVKNTAITLARYLLNTPEENFGNIFMDVSDSMQAILDARANNGITQDTFTPPQSN